MQYSKKPPTSATNDAKSASEPANQLSILFNGHLDRLGIDIKQLARDSSISYGTFYYLKSGESRVPRDKTLNAIMDILRLDDKQKSDFKKTAFSERERYGRRRKNAAEKSPSEIGRLVGERMGELGVTISEVAELTGIPLHILGAFYYGRTKSMRAHNMMTLELALALDPGTLLKSKGEVRSTVIGKGKKNSSLNPHKCATELGEALMEYRLHGGLSYAEVSRRAYTLKVDRPNRSGVSPGCVRSIEYGVFPSSPKSVRPKLMTVMIIANAIGLNDMAISRLQRLWNEEQKRRRALIEAKRDVET